jgi:hypothetical protein
LVFKVLFSFVWNFEALFCYRVELLNQFRSGPTLWKYHSGLFLFPRVKKLKGSGFEREVGFPGRAARLPLGLSVSHIFGWTPGVDLIQ